MHPAFNRPSVGPVLGRVGGAYGEMARVIADVPRRTVPVIEAAALPPGALLGRYEGKGGYTDCLAITIPGLVTQGAYVAAFYTTALFKLERLVLSVVLARPSTDQQARGLATGETATFAAWTVEAREDHQILLSDFLGSSRSWLMSVADTTSAAATTRLYFGTALVPRKKAGGLSVGFRAMVPLHRLYARALLRAAVRHLDSR